MELHLFIAVCVYCAHVSLGAPPAGSTRAETSNKPAIFLDKPTGKVYNISITSSKQKIFYTFHFIFIFCGTKFGNLTLYS